MNISRIEHRPILMNDFSAESSELKDEMFRAVQKVVGSKCWILGQSVREFEAAWAAKCGVSYAVGVGNGMDAIELSLRALNIGPGDEVITTSVTAFATIAAILRTGATPVVADIEAETGCMSLMSAERCLSAATKALVLVHLYGRLNRTDEWVRFCERSGIYLIEDCAQAHGAIYDGRSAGSFGVVGAFSFYPTKNLGTVGDAGIVTTNDSRLAEQITVLRNYGQKSQYVHSDLGINSRLDELQASILSVRLRWLDAWNTRRKAILEFFYEYIDNKNLRLLSKPIDADMHVCHLFVVLTEDRDGLQNHLYSKSNIASLVHYPKAVHQQPVCEGIKIDPAGLPCAERHVEKCLSIPCHPNLSDDELERIVTSLNDYEL